MVKCMLFQPVYLPLHEIFITMGQGKKTKREMVVLVRKLKRERALKQIVKRTFIKPVEAAPVTTPVEN